jgi:hypothetical protein
MAAASHCCACAAAWACPGRPAAAANANPRATPAGNCKLAMCCRCTHLNTLTGVTLWHATRTYNHGKRWHGAHGPTNWSYPGLLQSAYKTLCVVHPYLQGAACAVTLRGGCSQLLTGHQQYVVWNTSMFVLQCWQHSLQYATHAGGLQTLHQPESPFKPLNLDWFSTHQLVLRDWFSTHWPAGRALPYCDSRRCSRLFRASDGTHCRPNPAPKHEAQHPPFASTREHHL